MPHIFLLCVCNYLISSILYKVEKENDYFKKISVKYNNDFRVLTVNDKENGKEIFEIMTVIKTSYDSKDSKYADYEKIFDDSGYVYLAKVNPESDIKIDTKTLKDMIKTY